MSTRREFLTQSAFIGLVGAASATLAQGVRSAKKSGQAPGGTLKTYTLPQTDLNVSRIALGCAMLGSDWRNPEFVTRLKTLIVTGYDQGITFFDVADVYGFGKAEIALGEVLKESPGLRQKVVIQSKCGDDRSARDTFGVFNSSRKHIVSSAEGSLRRLGTDHLDVLLLHWPDCLIEPEEVATAFDELKRSGKVRYFGVSNHNRERIELLTKYVREPLVANQISLGLGHWDAQSAVTVDYCRAHEIQVQAYSPLRVPGIRGLQELLKPGSDAAEPIRGLSQLLTDIAKEHGATAINVMLAWLLRHPAGIVPVIGATKPEHVIENCAADRIDLSREDWYSLLLAASRISPRVTA